MTDAEMILATWEELAAYEAAGQPDQSITELDPDRQLVSFRQLSLSVNASSVQDAIRQWAEITDDAARIALLIASIQTTIEQTVAEIMASGKRGEWATKEQLDTLAFNICLWEVRPQSKETV